MTNPFEYQFFIEAFLALIALSLILPFIGNRLAGKGMSMLSDTISHTALAGVAIGLALSSFPLLYSILFSVLICLVMYVLQRLFPSISEILLTMVLSFSLALAGILSSYIKGNNLESYLFGSLFTITNTQIITLGVCALAGVFYEVLLYPMLSRLDYDEKAFCAAHPKMKFLSYLDMLVTTILIAVASNITGTLLIAGFISIPVFLGYQTSRSGRGSILSSMIFSLLSGMIGLFLSYFLNLHVGGTIIITSIAISVIVLPISLVRRRCK